MGGHRQASNVPCDAATRPGPYGRRQIEPAAVTEKPQERRRYTLASVHERAWQAERRSAHHFDVTGVGIERFTKMTDFASEQSVERFQRVIGSTPMRYLALWRLQLAAQALGETDKSVAAIAEEIGYGSEEAFSRAFKRYVAMSPGQWRTNRRERHRLRG